MSNEVKFALIVATPAEAENLRDLGAAVYVSGVGAVNAALAAYEAIARERPDVLVSAGIGGAFPGAGLRVGDAAISSEMIYGGLGAWDGDPASGRFLDLADLGLPLLPGVFNTLPAWDGARSWAGAAGAAFGPILTLESVTGSAAAAQALQARFPGALAEGMEGAGVAHAARRAGVAAVEVRGISNFVGPRDRDRWRIPEALRACREALAALLPGASAAAS